jgi:hypothetical protein
MSRFVFFGIVFVVVGALIGFGVLGPRGSTLPSWFLPAGSLVLLVFAFKRSAPESYMLAIAAVALTAGPLGLPTWAHGLVWGGAGASLIGLELAYGGQGRRQTAASRPWILWVIAAVAIGLIWLAPF